jgi:DNA-binding PadR family transcriptional regulator
MWDRYDARDNDRDRGNSWDRDLGGRGSASDRDRDKDRDPCDVFTKDLDLPHGRERRPVRERDRVYEIDGAESRALATIGAFRVIPESDLHDIRDDSQNSRQDFKHLEKEGLIRTSPLSSDDRAVTLTDRGRELLEANRYERDDRSHEPRQTFWAGLRKPRELEMGVADHVLESINGHLSRRMLEHYSHIRIDAKRQALDALDAARRNAAPNGNGDGDSSKRNEEAPDEGGIDALVEVSGELTSQSAVERVSALR